MNTQPQSHVAEVLSALDAPFIDHVRDLRRWFHRNPELSYNEADTAAHIIAELEDLGIPYRYDGVGHSVLADIEGLDPSRPAIALRADMDALPGHETTGATYESKNPGVMHACGHCAHMAMVIGAAHLLVRNPPPGPVRLIFQPAEERGGGARVAIEDGALDGVAAVFGTHVTHEWETGKIMIRDNDVTAQSDAFTIRVRGRGGHGARPHEAIDAIVISGFLITALQTLVSRETNPLHPSVVTIGKIAAGSAANVIAEEAELHGSIRTSLPDVRKHLIHGLRRMISAAAELHNAKIDIEIREGYPPVINEPRSTDMAREAAAGIIGADHVVASDHPSMGSEDFAFYLNERPGCFVRIGARHPDWEPVPLHSPGFDIDERALGIGVRFLDRVTRVAHERLDELADEV